VIDWLTIVLDCYHKPVNGGRVISVMPDGSVEWDTPKRLQVEGSYSSTIFVRTVERSGYLHDGQYGTQLWISGNPSKYFQGHNLFGSDDLPRLGAAFIFDVCARLGIKLLPADRQRVERGDYQLNRVDSTGMFELGDVLEVRAWIREAAKVMRGKYQSAKLDKGSTLYLGQNSRRISLKAYCKADELKAHPLPAEIPYDEYCKLVFYAQNKLRLEVVMRAMWLKSRGLERASAWGYNTARDLLKERLQAVNLPENLPLPVASLDALEELPARLKLAYQSWVQGHDLRKLMSKATFYRYRSELLKFGIDLNSPPRKVEESNVVPMWRYLVAEPAGVPEWAIGTPLYFDPSKPNLRVL